MRVLVIGRFQPPHRGHWHLLQQAEDIGELIIGIGSAQESRTERNPLSAAERESLLSLLPLDATVIQIPDINDDDRFVAHVEKIILETTGGGFDCFLGNDGRTAKLFEAAGYRWMKPGLQHRDAWEGVSVREKIRSGLDVSALVPEPIAKELNKLVKQGAFAF